MTNRLLFSKQIHVYRFDVYPVDTCPMNATEFEKAARRRNCTEKSRYLCAPDKYLSNLIEFCTDRKLSLFQNGIRNLIVIIICCYILWKSKKKGIKYIFLTLYNYDSHGETNISIPHCLSVRLSSVCLPSS